MKCQYCNSNIPENVPVCPVCGAIAPKPAADSPAESTVPADYPVYHHEVITPFTALKKYAVFSGRARRREYWLFKLLLLPPMILAQLISRGIITSPLLSLVVLVVSLGLVVPDLAVFCRRMHDVGKSGWMWLWNLLPMAVVVIPIPALGALLSLVSTGILLYYTLKDSEPGDNQYGPNPKGK